MGNIFGDLVDSFTGAGAKKALQEGMQNQINVAGQARDQQTGAIKSAGTEARGYFQPYASQGGQSYNLYNDTLGVNGADARTRAQDLYNSDDMAGRQRALDLKRSGWAQNASGSFNSGAAALADSRVRLQGYRDWQNQLMQNGQVGYNAAGNLAGTAQNEGNALAGAYGNYGNAVGNAYGQNAQAMAQANNAFAQNIIGLGGTLVRAFNPLGSSGSNNISYSQPGTAANGGWSTTVTPAKTGWFS